MTTGMVSLWTLQRRESTKASNVLITLLSYHLWHVDDQSFVNESYVY